MKKYATSLKILDSTLCWISETMNPRSLNQQAGQANILSNALTRGNTDFSPNQSVYSEQKPEIHKKLPSTDKSTTMSRSLTSIDVRQDHLHNWTSLDTEEVQSEAYQKLLANVHGPGVLSKNKYRTEPYMKIADLEKHRKCLRCLRTFLAIYGDLLS